MIFKQIESGGDRNYAYLISSEKTKEGVLIDPSPDPAKVMKAIEEEGVEIKYIINTHSHYDHSGGNDKFNKTEKGRSINFINCGDAAVVKDGETLELGGLIFEFILTPGHTEDSICIKIKDKLITGDTLFVGKVGGTGYGKDARDEYDSLHEKLMTLPEGTEVWPGHDYGTAPSSTIGSEKGTNPFILRETFEDFVDLKRNWAAYKREHNID